MREAIDLVKADQDVIVLTNVLKFTACGDSGGMGPSRVQICWETGESADWSACKSRHAAETASLKMRFYSFRSAKREMPPAGKKPFDGLAGQGIFVRPIRIKIVSGWITKLPREKKSSTRCREQGVYRPPRGRWPTHGSHSPSERSGDGRLHTKPQAVRRTRPPRACHFAQKAPLYPDGQSWPTHSSRSRNIIEEAVRRHK